MEHAILGIYKNPQKKELLSVHFLSNGVEYWCSPREFYLQMRLRTYSECEHIPSYEKWNYECGIFGFRVVYGKRFTPFKVI